ncbi:hypothetical protein LSAT2_024013 [Lamellibrachia satsuma]|nr:hypothetical protein LSAT2_024013 [Lamellibrachia satsuma]
MDECDTGVSLDSGRLCNVSSHTKCDFWCVARSHRRRTAARWSVTETLQNATLGRAHIKNDITRTTVAVILSIIPRTTCVSRTNGDGIGRRLQ